MTEERENELREQAAIILAAANGAEIEHLYKKEYSPSHWEDHDNDAPFHFDTYSYRVKPKPIPPKVGELHYSGTDIDPCYERWTNRECEVYYEHPFFGENQPKELKIKVIELTPEVEKAVKDAGIEI